MLVLAIESSCDETAVALLDSASGQAVRLIDEVISSQTNIHELYGGVVPELAAREHLHNLPLLVDGIMQKTRVSWSDIGLLAVTRGPGLKGCLLIGMDFAKGISVGTGIPLLGVNHIEGHVLAPMLDNPELHFPYLALIVSGGHTEIVAVRDVGSYSIVARTIDDAAGEAFDKSANLLGLAYPGGAKLAALADSATAAIPKEFELPKVMREAEGFSFSGLKTAIALLIKKKGAHIAQDPQAQALLAKSIQSSIVETLIHKLKLAISQTGLRNVALSGGVSANRALRAAAAAIPGVRVYTPSALHCMDNAAMIGYVGLKRFERGERNTLDISALSRWPVETLQLGNP
ncbi:MAG: tRNA (adenosine(37)-N6)-threonylcarbamoyltransferase complex transferase subunit TsaD [Deltaproteobacteria bacterium]|nr:tRNA (adenosine(37)-N6)-threonylcarbamoyltransferase complex transferase subunit TsaD [Deltaproteobacteria bacterium]